MRASVFLLGCVLAAQYLALAWSDLPMRARDHTLRDWINLVVPHA